MQYAEAIIIGGGPAGSSCADNLKKAGMEVLVLDKAAFPRQKVCAGWVTPHVWKYIDTDPKDYPHALTHFDSFQISIKKLHFKLKTNQYAIRRIEFDNWLLQKSGVKVENHEVKHIHPKNDGFVIDETFECKYLVGSGGTHCPVNKSLFEPEDPRTKSALVVALEEEFIYPDRDNDCYLWFLQNGLPGYSWYVPKPNGYVNIGIGGMESSLKSEGKNLRYHWELLIKQIETMGLIKDHQFKPVGHSYYLHKRKRNIRIGNAILAGDAAGFATNDMGEGIGAAVLSGKLAAESIINGGVYSPKDIPSYSFWSIVFDR